MCQVNCIWFQNVKKIVMLMIADRTYVVSGAKDHYRGQTNAGGIAVERVPEFSNLFSELPQYPSQSFRCGFDLVF